MKAMPKKDLIAILDFQTSDIIGKDTVASLFEKYGDDYYRTSSWSHYTLYNVNDKRIKVLRGVKE